MSTTFPGPSRPDQDPRGDDDDRSYAVAVIQGDDGWSVRELGDAALDSLADATAQMRRLRAEHDLSTQEGRTAYAIACAKYLAKVKEPVELENYVKELMVATGFPRDVLLAQIGRTELLSQEQQRT